MRVCCRYPNENVDGLEISRIDPAAVTAAYRTDVLAKAGDVRGREPALLGLLGDQEGVAQGVAVEGRPSAQPAAPALAGQ